MGIEFAKGTDGKEDVCILVKPKDHIDYCSWLEIARLMKWECNKDDLFIDPEVTDDDYWELTL
jgi:hypothetical protein